jgi:hypothetical protein
MELDGVVPFVYVNKWDKVKDVYVDEQKGIVYMDKQELVEYDPEDFLYKFCLSRQGAVEAVWIHKRLENRIKEIEAELRTKRHENRIKADLTKRLKFGNALSDIEILPLNNDHGYIMRVLFDSAETSASHKHPSKSTELFVRKPFYVMITKNGAGTFVSILQFS